MKHLFGTLLICLLSFASLSATHNRGGEIVYQQIDTLTIVATVVTYTTVGSPADRDSINLCWGDGSCQLIGRTNGPGDPPQGEVIAFGYQRNRYTAQHTYATLDSYTLTTADPNRSAGILNIDAGNSVSVLFYLQTTFTLLSPADGPLNSAPTPLVPPLNIAFLGQPFEHVIHAVDAEGDSLAYEWAIPLVDMGTAVPNFVFPDQIVPGPQNQIGLHPQTGEVVWDAPQAPGLYTIAVAILAYRNGVEVDRVIRDMQILVVNAISPWPELETTATVNKTEYIDLVSGDSLRIAVQGSSTTPEVSIAVQPFGDILTDPDLGASFTFEGTAAGYFEWIVPEAAVRSQPYQLTFRATNGDGYANFTTFVIRVDAVSSTAPGARASEAWTVRAFPNPFREQLHFALSDPGSAPVELELFDLSGRRCYFVRTVAGPVLTVPAGVLPRAGGYVYRLHRKGSVVVGKVWLVR